MSTNRSLTTHTRPRRGIFSATEWQMCSSDVLAFGSNMSIAWTRALIWLGFAEAGTCVRRSSSKTARPTASCCCNSRNASDAATAAAYSYFVIASRAPDLYRIDSLASTRNVALRLVSSSYCLMYTRSVRPSTFQSMCLMSSPGVYSRWLANSTENPWNGLRCRPEMNPSTTSLACKSSRVIFERTFGSRYFFSSSTVLFAMFLYVQSSPEGATAFSRG